MPFKQTLSTNLNYLKMCRARIVGVGIRADYLCLLTKPNETLKTSTAKLMNAALQQNSITFHYLVQAYRTSKPFSSRDQRAILVQLQVFVVNIFWIDFRRVQALPRRARINIFVGSSIRWLNYKHMVVLIFRV